MLLKDYFNIKELVCKHVYCKFGEYAWQFFDDRLLETLLVLREKLNKPITVNDWHLGGNFSQRGLRCNVCQIVFEKSQFRKVYVSTHIQGVGIDFDVKGMSADEVRDWIKKNQILLPHPVRLEDCVNWVHLDMRNDGSKAKVIYFKG